MPERLVSTTCLGNLNDPSYELLLRRKLGGVFEVDELLLDWDQADVCAFVGVTELGRTIDVRLDATDGGRLADGDVLAIDRSGMVPVAVVVRLRSAEVYLVEVDRMDPIALAHACWEIGNMHAPLFRGDSDEHTVRMYTPLQPVLGRMLRGVEGVRLSVVTRELDADRLYDRKKDARLSARMRKTGFEGRPIKVHLAVDRRLWGKHMGLEGIKLIACDLDGTLLHPGERELRSEAFELIDELHRRGIVFMPASGRQYASLRYLFAPVADELAYVCENGTLVMSEGRAVVKRSMERGLAMVIANAVVAYPHADVTLSCEGHLYAMSGNDAFVDHLRHEVHCDVAVVDRPEDIDEDVIKIGFQTPKVDYPAAREYFESLFSDRVDVMTSGAAWTDLIGFGSGKGSALADYGRALGISPDEMMAFGDNENDRDMLNVVGHPYLMESCNPTMRGVNDRVRYVHTVEEELRRLLAE